MTIQQKHLVVDGIEMRWLERGTGVPVVLVHGIPTSPALWRHVMPRIADARVLAWEMVGYGQSIAAGRDRDISVAQQADYLRAWMRAVEIERAVLVGHDLGGGVVQIAAVRDPAVAAGLVLVNAIAYDSWPIPSVKAMRALSPLTRRMPLSLLRTNLGVLLRRGHDDARVAAESLDVHFAPYAAADGARTLVRQMKALRTDDTLAVAPSLPQLRGTPAHVVWGAADQFQKVAFGERLARDLGCAITRIAGGKHFIPEDHPDEVARVIDSVVARVHGSEVDVPPPGRRPHLSER